METKKQHPFLATLGPGPYQFVGVFDLGPVIACLHAGNVNAYNNGLGMAPKDVAIGSCAHCGQGIMVNCIVQTGDGKRHAVGSDCIRKVHCQDPFTAMTELERKLKKLKRDKDRESRERTRLKKAAEVWALVQAGQVQLKKIPHPHKYFADQNRTAMDYCTFIYRNGHLSTSAAKELKSKLKDWLQGEADFFG